MKALAQNDEALLCGRADIVREIADNCRAERLTILTSEPGMGVTSLLQAGVAPALRREGFIVAAFSDWQGRFFLSRLKEAVADSVREKADPMFSAESERLDVLLEHIRVRTRTPVAIVFDQFEDYLRCHTNTHMSDTCDAELAQAVAARKGVFVIGMQAHAVPAFERFRQHIPNLLGFRIQLPPLTVEAAREAVVSEAARIDVEVEPAAIEALTSAPAVVLEENRLEEKKVHPFFLKVATAELLDAEARLKSPFLRAATIDARGGVDRVVLESLDTRIGELGSTQTDLLFRWCNILISPRKHRLSVTEKGLTDYAGRLNRFVPTLLQTLTNIGLVRSVETPEANRYEISRECFAPILRNWWERREAAIVARRRAAFRVKSLTVAISAIILMYIMWIIFGQEPK